MSTISCGAVHFINLPEFFLIRYTKEINAWADNICKVGMVKHFVLREGHLSDLSPNPEQGAELISVALLCKPSLRGVEIMPRSERDKDLIAKHCEKLEKAGMAADAFTPEPSRPWVPFMPRYDA